MKFANIVRSRVFSLFESDTVPVVSSEYTIVCVDNIDPAPAIGNVFHNGKFLTLEVTAPTELQVAEKKALIVQNILAMTVAHLKSEGAKAGVNFFAPQTDEQRAFYQHCQNIQDSNIEVASENAQCAFDHRAMLPAFGE